MLLDVTSIHFVGIGGVGMSALARVLLEAGHAVSGSDLKESVYTTRLREAGVRVAIGHREENVGSAELVVVSSAIPLDNPEIRRATSRGIRIIKRAELLGDLTRRFRGIAVAGTHGKTTTSSMIGFILERAGLDPTLLIGGDIANLGTNARMGQGQYLVAEADEFDGSFLRLSPWMAIITNVEADHLDFYHDFAAIKAAFGQFAAGIDPSGYLLVCADDQEALNLAAQSVATVITYGLSETAQWRATQIAPNGIGGSDFTVQKNGTPLGRFSLRVPGCHNVQNALAATAAVVTAGVSPSVATQYLADFSGARRRFEHKDTVDGIAIYDDYAHHPTEIRATLRAARQQHKGRIWCVFQPHTYHRTRQLWSQFLTAFDDADMVIVCDVYLPDGREVDTLGVTSQDLVKAMSHPGVEYLGSLESATKHMCSVLRDGDLMITMGAGNVVEVADAVVRYLRARTGGA